MSRKQTLLALGILILLSPFVGLPYAWLMWVLPALGLLVIVVAFAGGMRRQPMLETSANATNETESAA